MYPDKFIIQMVLAIAKNKLYNKRLRNSYDEVLDQFCLHAPWKFHVAMSL